MDVLDEVEDLFKKLEVAPHEVKEAAFKKIIEKIGSADCKKKRDPAVPRRRLSKRRKKEESLDDRIDLHDYGSECHDSEYIVENFLTRRGRKAQRICYAQTKVPSLLDLQKKGTFYTQDNISTSIKKASSVVEDKCCISDDIDEQLAVLDINEITKNVEKRNKMGVTELVANLEDLDGDSKLENSFEESQLIIVDPADSQEDAGESKDTKMDTVARTNTDGTSGKVNEVLTNRSSEDKKIASFEETVACELKSSKGKEGFTCSECSFHTYNKILLRNHMRKHCGPHKCHDCGKSFPQACALRIHMKRHRGQRDFPCDYRTCSYRAYTKGDKVRHMTLHTGERCHQCQYCGKAFAKDSTLREHVKSIHERHNKHICATCGFATYRANNLRVHISMRHRGEYNNHVCPVCGAKVKQRTAFLDHIRSHTGERPFKCSLCERSFTCVARLTVHQKAVHGPRQFVCKHCQKSFQTKHHLERHELIHTNKKPFACPYCSYSCNTQGNVTKHVKGVHNKPDFSFRKYKAEQQVNSDCKTLKSEWIEKGEKVTTEYLKDLSKKIGREVTLLELKEREAEKNKRVTEDLELVKKRRCRKQEHDYHSKINPEEDQLEEEADEPPPVLLSVTPGSVNTASSTSIVGSSIPALPQTHVLQGMTLNRSANAQPTVFIQTTRNRDLGHLQSVLTDKFQKSNNPESHLISGQNINFCLNEQRVHLEDQMPLHVVYHSTCVQQNNNSQENAELNSSKYNFNFVEVKRDAASSQTVVVIINTDNH